ncbi:2-amino-4-hydroxy-6-hydroxymethyldihydropteridine diphosphokinase, partial [Streptococcus suis]
CQKIELDLDRVRIEKWGQRTIDLDIIFWDQEIIQSERLTVPHPYAHERAFVLQPLADIAADYVHPILGQTVVQLLAKVQGKEDIRQYR